MPQQLSTQDAPHGSMLHWPNTPSQKRYLDALAATQRSQETAGPTAHQHPLPSLREDIAHLKEYLLTPEYQEDTKEIVKLIWGEETSPSNTQHTLINIAMTGESPTTIGLVILKEEDRHNPGRSTFASTRLQRHHDWLGLNPDLPLVQDLQVRIYESRSLPAQPAAAVAMPAWSDGKPPRYALPKGHAQDLKRIFKWHGAAQVFWVPIYRWD